MLARDAPIGNPDLHLADLVSLSSTIRTDKPVVSPKLVLFLPYPTAKVSLSFAFSGI